MIQFIGESVLITLAALILAVPLVEVMLPWLNNIAACELSFDLFQNGILSLFMVSMLILVGGLAGIYPAMVLTRFKPITVLKCNFKTGRKGTALRKTLVVIQFSLSIALICLTSIVQKQINFINTKR